MKFIVITPPETISGEASLIPVLFCCGIDTLHLRKPKATHEQCVHLLDAIAEECRKVGISAEMVFKNTVVHDHHDLCETFGMQGVHLNSRHPNVPAFFGDSHQYTLSASCHSLEEAQLCKPHLNYIFLSPIFDSISKQGYASAYTHENLYTASEQGIIDNKVMALGGVSLQNIDFLRQVHFGGAAFLGDIWNKSAHRTEFIRHVEKLTQALK